MAEPARRTRHDADDPELLCQAAELVIQTQFPSPSMLQRRLWIGFATAANVLDRLEQAGVVGPAAGIRPRDVLVTPDQLLDVLATLRHKAAALMPDPTTPSAVLIAAADHMQRYGWIQDGYCADYKNPRACSVCPRGAIAAVVAGHPLYAVDWPVHRESTDDPYADSSVFDAEQADYDLIKETEAALAGYLLDEGAIGVPAGINIGPGELIELWADREDRTMPQILGAMRAAAERGRTDG